MTDSLSSYGYAFQIKVITSLLVDKSFLQQISDILSPKYFESDANNWIVDTIHSFASDSKYFGLRISEICCRNDLSTNKLVITLI